LHIGILQVPSHIVLNRTENTSIALLEPPAQGIHPGAELEGDGPISMNCLKHFVGRVELKSLSSWNIWRQDPGSGYLREPPPGHNLLS
jgi:hypothetical protein